MGFAGAAEGSPALSMLDIGCCAKFGFGGFGAAERKGQFFEHVNLNEQQLSSPSVGDVTGSR